jgi:hypothetical protein
MEEGYSETSTSMTSHRTDSTLRSQYLQCLLRHFRIVSSDFVATAIYEEQDRTLARRGAACPSPGQTWTYGSLFVSPDSDD